MDRELEGTLNDLGLSATEAATYVALLKSAESGPVSAYRLAQNMGRDPANLTKVLSAMCRRGAVRASKHRPRLYSPTAPEDFTGRLIARLQDRQKRALELLRDIGTPPPDQEWHVLTSRPEATSCALRLIAAAKRIILVDATADVLLDLAQSLEMAANERGIMIRGLCPAPLETTGARIISAAGRLPWHAMAPGPWLRLAVDGRSCLEMLAHPVDQNVLLYGCWSCSPAQAFLAHRNLAREVILSDLLEQLEQGPEGEFASRKASELATALLHQIPWRQQWNDAGLPDYAPAQGPQRSVAISDDTAQQQGTDKKPASRQKTGAETAATEPDDSLQFVFRRPKK